jgi:hypothetical protein
VFAAQFSLSHLAWLITYPVAGLAGTNLGFTLTWSILAALAAVGSIAGLALWPREAEVEAEDRELEVFAKASFGDTPLKATRRRAPKESSRRASARAYDPYDLVDAFIGEAYEGQHSRAGSISSSAVSHSVAAAHPPR